MRAMLERVEAMLERVMLRALKKHETDGLMTSEEVAIALGYKLPDGNANLNAFKQFMARELDFAALAIKMGRRYYWRRPVFLRWLDEHPGQQQRAEARGARAGRGAP